MFHTVSNIYFEFSKNFIMSTKLLFYITFFCPFDFLCKYSVFSIHISLIYVKLSKLKNSTDGSKREMTY